MINTEIRKITQDATTKRPVADPDVPIVLDQATLDLPYPNKVAAPMVNCDGALVLSSKKWVRLFEGASSIPETTKIFVGTALIEGGATAQMFVGTRVLYEVQPQKNTAVTFSFAFSTSENLDLFIESAAGPAYLYYSYR